MIEKTKIIDIFGILFLLFFAFISTIFIDFNYFFDLCYLIPTLNGIIIAGVIASITIIFASLDLNTISKIKLKNEDTIKRYKKIIKLLNRDVFIILSLFCLSIISIFIISMKFENIFQYSIQISQFLLTISIFSLLLSFIIVVEIVKIIFQIQELKLSLLDDNST